jgi:hypothetical protein
MKGSFMSIPSIKRFFSEDVFEVIQKDLKFLIDKIHQSKFEYDLQIRDDYCNLYYRGNNIGKITPKRRGLYTINIHTKFIDNTIKKRFNGRTRATDEYLTFPITRKQLRNFYSTANLQSMARKVKNEAYKEELVFEQMLLTDNIGRDDLIIIDRQVKEGSNQTRIDILALAKKEGKEYQFRVIEIKLGNNPELKSSVVNQLNGYIKRISDNFADYKKCYLKNLWQKQQLGIINPKLEVNIVEGAQGMIVVGFYSGIAEKSIEDLRRKAPNIKVAQFKNQIPL